jgi:putative ABC transport system permease protein
MNLLQSVLEALESLNSNKLRSGLTILGIVIGVAAVIAMLAVGEGAQETITGAISGVGTNLLFVFSGNFQEEVRNPEPLNLADVDALRDQFQAPSIVNVAPVINGQVKTTFSGHQATTTVNGITSDYAAVRNYKVTEGEFINQEHLLGQASVALLGPELAQKLFDRKEGLVGETIRIEGQPFRVIGVLESKGGGAFGSQDDVIMIPFTTAKSRILQRTRDQVDVIFVQAVDSESVTSATEEITQILRARHRIMLGPNDFTVFSQEDFVQTARTITGVFTIFLGGIAGISLLVGGIGIMNIMLVSVTERTREIGLRKALGARKRDILIQFLTESALLSMMGGIIGIGFGWFISFVVGRIAAANNTPFTPAVGLNAVLLATIFATVVGLFFGIYPANRAANLEPVEALRYE